MSEDEFTVTPFFDDPLTEIHPSIGVVDGVAYVGMWVPCQISDRKGHVKHKDFMYLITDKCEKILCTEDELMKHHWRLGYKPIHTVNRWSLADVQAYLDGTHADVNPFEMYESVKAIYQEFIEFPDEKSYTLHALWSLGTYFHHLFNTYPYLYVGGVKRSGKTKTLTVHYCVDLNAILSGNITVSSIFRTIQNQRATLLIDETEQLSNPQRDGEFRHILISGYKKGAKTYRVGKDAKDRYETEEFELFSGKVLANISGLEDVLEDRCIMGFQKRSLNKSILNREINIVDPRFSVMRGGLYTLFLSRWQEVAAIYADLNRCSELSELCECVKCDPHKLKDGKEYLTGREMELWKPLLTMAKFIDDHAPISELHVRRVCSERANTYTGITQKGDHATKPIGNEHIANDFTSSSSSSLTPTASSQVQGDSPAQIGDCVNAPSLPSFHTLCSLILDMACTLAKQRHTENMTEVGDDILVQCLLNLVKPTQLFQWVTVRALKEELCSQFEDHQDWLTSKWVGASLRRLGFSDKRRVGTGYQYNISPSAVIDLKKRMQVDDLETEENLRQTLDSARQWISTNKDEDGSIDTCSLVEFLKKSGESDPNKLIEILKRDGVLFTVPKLGKLGAR